MSTRAMPQTAAKPGAVRRVIETCAISLTDSGFHRSFARVFVALLLCDRGRMTARELAEALAVSPAAISGGVRYLTEVGVIARDRAPGERRDSYRVREDEWYLHVLQQPRLAALRECSDRGVAIVGADTAAGRRLSDLRNFVDFVISEIPDLLERWRQGSSMRRSAPPSPAAVAAGSHR